VINLEIDKAISKLHIHIKVDTLIVKLLYFM